MCQNATFYEQCPPLHFPFAKSNYFLHERRNEEHDFGQSNFGTSNVRALRAIIYLITRQYLQARGAQTPTYNYYPTYVR